MCNNENIKLRLLEIIKEITGEEYFEYFRNSIEHYVLSTYMDSLDIVELVMRVEEEYNISIDDYSNWEDLFLEDVVKYIKNKLCENISNPHPLGVPRAHYITKVLIKRWNGKDHDVILDDGEVGYNRTDKEFYVGDGNTHIRDLKSYNNIVEGDNGIIYLVRVDENGIPEAKEFVVNGKNGNKFKFKTKE